MVRQNLNQVLLLIVVQKGEQVQGIGIHPAGRESSPLETI